MLMHVPARHLKTQQTQQQANTHCMETGVKALPLGIGTV